jgi:hypothetical protein
MSESAPDHLALGPWLAVVAEALGVATPQLTRDEHALILDLARIAAHRSERIAAPITAFLVGTVLAGLSGEERASRLRSLVAALETEPADASPDASAASTPSASSTGPR